MARDLSRLDAEMDDHIENVMYDLRSSDFGEHSDSNVSIRFYRKMRIALANEIKMVEKQSEQEEEEQEESDD